MRRTAAAIAVVAILAALAACSSIETGAGMPTLSAAERSKVSAASATAPLRGALHTASNGCFLWAGLAGSAEDGTWIIWPEGTRQDADVVVLPGGERVRDGAALIAEGVPVPLASLPGGADTCGYFGSVGRYCDRDERGALVLAEVRAAG